MTSGDFVHFTLNKPSQIKLGLISIDVKTILSFDIGFLQAGNYSRKLERIATGSYMLIFHFNEQKSLKN